MTTPDRNQIQNILTNIFFKDGSSVQERASEVIIKKDDLGFSVDVTNLDKSHADEVKSTIVKRLEDLPNIGKINVVLTSERQATKTSESQNGKIHIENVAKTILVAAGKGGVGKSTISALLAHKLTLEGKKVGIIDADIYGPSIPHIFGLSGKPSLENKRMVPFKKSGILINSIGFLTDPSSSVSWRGPMTSKALYQLLSLTNWEGLDYLIIDSPPGTGDIHLSLLQNYIIDKVLMVTTPQVVSQIDVVRSINLYNKFNIEIAGIIENMSYYNLPISQEKIELFQGNGGGLISQEQKIPLLAKLPILPELSAACDQGKDISEYSYLLDDIGAQKF